MAKNEYFLWSRKVIQKLDIYSKPVTLTHRGQENFQTLIGGVLSVITVILALLVFIYMMALENSKVIGTFSTTIQGLNVDESKEIK